MRLTRLVRPILLGMSLLGLGCARAAAQAPPSQEYEVKAAYILNFTRYVEWPADAFGSAQAPIVIGVLGRNPFGPLLGQTIAGRTSQGRPIELLELEGVADAAACHAVFLSLEEWRPHPEVLAQLARRGLLTIGEGDDFARRGGVLGFVPVGQTVRFGVNLEAARQAGLRISSRMLALAVAIHDPAAGAP